jgi:L-ascorbate metabolism protein UlaG (beta-lactamase superfamily)
MSPEDRSIPDALRAQFKPYFESASSAIGYRNPWPHPALPTLKDVLRWKTGRNLQRESGYRAQPLKLPDAPLADFETLTGAATRLFWIGHASFMLELDGARFVIDPIFGRAGGFVPRVTPAAAQPAELNGLTAVLITHGHHDHLDPTALRQLAAANSGELTWVVPRGLGKVLPDCCERVLELEWWQHVTIGGVRINLVPAQHWHRRGMFDENKSLWGGYVLEGTHRVYHSGDTGYFGGFSAIGRVFEGIDVACLPLGAYEPRWFMAAQHMSPEGSLDALADLAATHFVGMHWAAYDLSDEAIEAGPELASSLAAERGIGAERFHILKPGGSLALQGPRLQTRAKVLHGWTQG